MPQSTVYVERIPAQSSAEQIAKGVARLLGFIDIRQMVKDKTVLIKPNLSGQSPKANTDPRVIYGVVSAVEEFAGRVIVADGSMIGMDTAAVIKESGLPKILSGTRAEIVDLKSGAYLHTKVVRGRCSKSISISEVVAGADIVISLPKMKTHLATGVSLSMKNLKGVLHEYDMLHFHHVNLSECLVDLTMAVKPALCIVDGLIAYDAFGQGAVEMGCLIAGTDPVAVDSTAARAMGIDPATIYGGTMNESHIKRAHDRKVGRMLGVEVVGDLPEMHFTLPPSDLSQIQIPDGIEIIDGDPCPACVGMLASVLQKLDPSKTPKGKTTILVGPNAPPPEKTMGRTIIIGNCLHRTESNTEGSVFVIGCPPNGTYDLLPILEA